MHFQKIRTEKMRHLPLFLCLAAAILSAQPAPAPRSRSQFEQIRDQLLVEINTKNTLEQRTSALQSKMETIPVTGNDVSKLREYLLLHREINAIQQELQNASRRQLNLLNAISNADAQNETYPQFRDYLIEAREQLQSIGITQKNLFQTLQRIAAILPERVRALPPPSSFTSQSGLKMHICGTGSSAFYITETPFAECAGQSLPVVQQRLKALSEQENAFFQLPSIEEVQLAVENGLAPECALWTRTEWHDHGSQQEALLNRFTVTMYLVWDKNSILGRTPKGKDCYGELPEAHYPQLGAYLTTPVKTGILLRWAKVQASLAQPQEAAK